MRMYCATLHVHSATPSERPWAELKAIVDKVHHHVCGHSNYHDIQILLDRNGLWNADVRKYLSTVLYTCSSCTVVQEPKGRRPVSLSSMSRDFNQLVCVDHLFVDSHKVFYCMDSVTRYSAGCVVTDTTMQASISTFDLHWITPFWIPQTVLFDQAFNNTEFTAYLSCLGINSRPIPPRRHNKNVIESKHRIIRDIYLRLRSATDENNTSALLVVQALRISNDLYGSDVMSAQELAKGYTRPLAADKFPVPIPDEILAAHEQLLSKRKLTLILRSKSVIDNPVNVADLFQVYIKLQHEKRGHWSASKPILAYDPSSRTVTVPGANGKRMKAAIEDIRPSLPENELALAIQDSIDALDSSLDSAISDLKPELTDPNFNPVHDIERWDTKPRTDPDDDQSGMFTSESSTAIPDPVSTGDPLLYEPSTSYPTVPNPNPSTHTMTTRSQSALHSHDVELSPGLELTSTELDATLLYLQRFHSKEFLLHQAEGLPTFVTENAYNEEENKFKKQVKEIHVSKIPKNSNVITSHVLYKIKTLDDSSLLCKDRIAPHGNKDKYKESLKTDAQTCPPIGLRILLSICVIFNWSLVKINIKSAFLQSGSAERDVYVVPPRECVKKGFFWLLLTAAYGLVNANAKWQDHSDSFLRDLGFVQLAYVPQLFFRKLNNELHSLAVKVVDDILVSSVSVTLDEFVAKVSTKYKVGTIVRGPALGHSFSLD